MISIPHFGLKTLLIGFFIVKIAGTILYLAVNYSVSNNFFNEKIALAQENEQSAKDIARKDPTFDNRKYDESYDEIRGLLEIIETKRLRIEKEKERLEKQQVQLESLKQEIEAKIDKLSKIQQQIEAGLTKKEEQETEQKLQMKQAEASKINRLVKVYTSMKPKTAASLIDKLDMEVVLKLFSRMKGEQIGGILSYVDPTRAAKISECLAQRPVQPMN